MMGEKSNNYRIIGAKGTIASKDSFFNCVREYTDGSRSGDDTLVQFLDADVVCGKQHLESAIDHAVRAVERGDAISGSLAMELLIYASGEVQINSAIAKMGIKDGSLHIACIVDPTIKIDDMLVSLELTRDDSLLNCTDEKLLRMGLSEESIRAAGSHAVADLVLEIVSMVDVKK